MFPLGNERIVEVCRDYGEAHMKSPTFIILKDQVRTQLWYIYKSKISHTNIFNFE